MIFSLHLTQMESGYYKLRHLAQNGVAAFYDVVFQYVGIYYVAIKVFIAYFWKQ